MKKILLLLMLLPLMFGCVRKDGRKVYDHLVDDFVIISNDANRCIAKGYIDSARYYLGKMDYNLEMRKWIRENN